MPSSNTPLLNLILLIDVTFSTPTIVNASRYVETIRLLLEEFSEKCRPDLGTESRSSKIGQNCTLATSSRILLTIILIGHRIANRSEEDSHG